MDTYYKDRNISYFNSCSNPAKNMHHLFKKEKTEILRIINFPKSMLSQLSQWQLGMGIWTSDFRLTVHHIGLLSVEIQRRQWHPTPILLPGKSHGWRSLEATVPGVAKSLTRLSNFTFSFYFHALERKRKPTPVFLPGESQGQGSLVGCCLWGHTDWDMMEAT